MSRRAEAQRSRGAGAQGAYKGRFCVNRFETWISVKKLNGQATGVRPPQPPPGGSRGQSSDLTRPRAPLSADFSRLCSRVVPPSGGLGGPTTLAQKPGRRRQHRSRKKPTPISPPGGSRGPSSDFTYLRAPMGTDFSRLRRRVLPNGGVGGPAALAKRSGRRRQHHPSRVTDHESRTTHHSSRPTHYALRTTSYVLRPTFHAYPLILIIFLLTLLLTACAAAPVPRLAAHIIHSDHESLALADAAEFDTIVKVFPWREVEPTQDQFHWQAVDQIVAGAEYYGLDVVVRLDQHPAWASAVDLSLNAPPDKLADYRDFVQRTAARYRGRVKAYIIWNEPNLAIEWGGEPPDPAAFTALLKTGYEAVKAADPEALVVSAGLAPTNSNDRSAMDERLFLEQMYEAGGAAYFDVLGAHPYSFGQPPDAPARDGDHPHFRRLAELRDIMAANGDAYKPVWITEMGWTVDPPPEQAGIGVSAARQADYLAEALDIIRREWPWVGLVTVWNLSRPKPDDPFGGYSLLDASGEPRPAYIAWRQAAGSRVERGLPALAAADQQHNPVTILAQDAIIRLGDSDLQPPWRPLFAGRKPSLRWTGGFYMVDPGQTDWEVQLELMQQNEIGAEVKINGVPLSPDLPQQDFTRRWITVSRPAPNELLRPGYNEMTITTVRLLPDAQHDDQFSFVWDDYQVRNVRLVRPVGR